MSGCPKWDDDRPSAGQLQTFIDDLESCLAESVEICKSGTPSAANLKKWHKKIFAKMVPLYYYAGNFRQPDHKKKCLEKDVDVAGQRGTPFRFVPLHVENYEKKMHEQFQQLEKEWPRLSGAERVQRLAFAIAFGVGQFIRIHPFLNGNGRISRIVWNSLMQKYELKKRIRIFPRPDGSEYSECMAASMRGDFSLLIYYIIENFAHV
jgi:fido (protein-threonine AMPylation protein)